MACIEARGLRKTFGTTIALDGIDLRVDEGRILGIIGPNGAGKSTALNAILGLTSHQGELEVLGRDPWTERDRLMRDVSFIADVSLLPRWIRVSQVLDYVAGVHPRFDRAKADLIAALNDAFTYCDKAYDGMTDASAIQMGKLHGGDVPKLGVLATNNIHKIEHYGNLVTYLRMKNIVPPTSEPAFMQEMMKK